MSDCTEIKMSKLNCYFCEHDECPQCGKYLLTTKYGCPYWDTDDGEEWFQTREGEENEEEEGEE